MKKPLFTGACTALVTPFWNGEVNYPMLEILLNRQIDAGICAVVVCGTTGEAATLSDQEKLEIVRRSKEIAGDRLCILAGTGSNSTAHAVALSKAAQAAGADALLVVSPYYNKATPDGLCSHFQTVADSVAVPLVLYNVPSRTGVDIPISVYQRLSENPNIVGVKEASGDIVKIAKIRKTCPPSFCVWAGNDDQIVPVMALGGQGAVSVVSNLYPAETQTMIRCAETGDYDTAAALQLELLDLIECLFYEVNPIPVKAAMKLLGFDCGPCRLPLTSAAAETLRKLKYCMHA